MYLVDDAKNIYQTTIALIHSEQATPATYLGKISHPINPDTKVQAGKLYQIATHSNKLIISDINKPEETIATLQVGDSYGFDVTEDNLIFSTLKHASSELHQTKQLLNSKPIALLTRLSVNNQLYRSKILFA